MHASQSRLLSRETILITGGRLLNRVRHLKAPWHQVPTFPELSGAPNQGSVVTGAAGVANDYRSRLPPPPAA